MARPPAFTRCTVCHEHDFSVALPWRDTDVWGFDGLCVVCLDALLRLFPLRVRVLHDRELTGKVVSACVSTAPPPRSRSPRRRTP